jgi:hypothetical protein
MRPDDIKFDDGDADAAIDRAVREMMSAEPRADFGRRVRARLERPARVVFTIPRLAAVAALSAAVALFVLTRDNRPTTPEPRVAIHTAPSTQPGSTTPTSPRVSPDGPTNPVIETPRRPTVVVDRGERTERVPEGRVQAASIDPGKTADVVTEIEPLTPISPITVSAVTQAPISRPEIQIAPLDLSPIEIAPLTAPR